MLRLTTFGGVGIRNEESAGPSGGELPVSRRALALLVLVAAAPSTGISRDKVLALLWPESDEDRGRNALRQALHTLRRELRVPDSLRGTDTLRLDPGAVSSDLHDFEAARADGRMEEAVGLYAGPFLDGFHIGGAPDFERWVEETRAAYASELASVLEQLARDAGRAGNPALAVRWWRRLAALDPLDSSVALALMQALAAAGDRAGALRHGQVHERLIREDLGAALDPAIGSLMNRLRGAPPAGSGVEPQAADAQADRGFRPTGAATPQRSGSFLARLREELAVRYAIAEEVERSRGGAIRLLRARDVRHERNVILKVLNPALSSMLDVDRFLREVKLTARLSHPHILPLLDSGEANGVPWLAMPDIGGVSLRVRLATEERMAPDEAIRLIGELAGALDHAHSHGVLHRDVSPENILLAEGHALLANMGVARALDAAATPKLTETGMLVGSPAYMSPEQAAGASTVDGRSDQYALGCVLFEILKGEPLFSGPSPQAIMAKRAAFSPRTLEPIDGVPSVVMGALIRSLSTDPARRFPTMADFAAALAGWSPGRPSGSTHRWMRWFGSR